jgi:hypothetical protein
MWNNLIGSTTKQTAFAKMSDVGSLKAFTGVMVPSVRMNNTFERLRGYD